MIYVVWPEGEATSAVMCEGWLAMQWKMLGPMGLMSSLRGKRMSRARPCLKDDIPMEVAIRSERAMQRLAVR